MDLQTLARNKREEEKQSQLINIKKIKDFARVTFSAIFGIAAPKTKPFPAGTTAKCLILGGGTSPCSGTVCSKQPAI